MRWSTSWAIALSLRAASAFKDTSPFFLLSTSELLTPSANILSAASLSQRIIPQLEKCPSDTYIIVSQPGVNAADFADKRATPYLRMLVEGKEQRVRSSYGIKDVIGSLDVESISRTVEEKCNAGYMKIDASTGLFALAEDMRPRVINVDLPALPSMGKDRALKLAENDAFLSSLLDMLPSSSFTLLYSTSPVTNNPSSSTKNNPSTNHKSPVKAHKSEPESFHLEPTFQAPVHMELKRDFAPHKQSKRDDDKTTKLILPDGPLFERYQFLSPGIFMGIIVVLIFLGAISVGINGVSSLKVTYQAFDRDTGPASAAGSGQGGAAGGAKKQ